VSVVHSVRSRKFLAVLAALGAVATMLFGARAASADEVWFQSYQRGSASDVCVAQPGETPWQDSWGTNLGWSPSWEQWANNGQGGWVCSRSITWARDSAARVYNVGDIGPGGGLVFLISGGLTYEMAPKTWSGLEDPLESWCDTFTVAVTTGTAIGTGAANTAAMADSGACGSDAAAAVLLYAPAGTSAGQWFLPSKDELNAMCNYSRDPTSPVASSGNCYGTAPGTAQDGTFASGDFGFSGDFRLASGEYWSSSQVDAGYAFLQIFGNGDASAIGLKIFAFHVRPVRAF
jgi:hypothetical protein